MLVIGQSRLEGIDWVQAQLHGIARPLAERTYFALVSRGIVAEGKDSVSLTEAMSAGEIVKVGMEEETMRDNRMRSRMTRRHHMPTFQKKLHLKQGNSIDCISLDDDNYQ